MAPQDAADTHSFVDLTNFRLDPQVIRLLPEDFCRKHQTGLLGAMPESDRSPAALGMLNPADEEAVRAAEKQLGRRVRRVQLNAYEIDRILAAGFSDIPVKDETIQIKGGWEHLSLSHESQIHFGRDQTAPEMVGDALSEAVRTRATDIHLETYARDVDLRFRVDGVLRQISTPLSPRNIAQVVNYLKILCNLDITERRRPQEGRVAGFFVDVDGRGRQVDFRASFCPGPWGEDVVLRVLDQRRLEIRLEELGMPEGARGDFEQAVRSPGGIVLVAGPTASGKTTTLYATLRILNSDQNKILTVEDPIEYVLPRVNQKQVSAYMSFADYARSFMRQNPDILMIGEIRDEPTAQIALRAAQTGHRVLSTVHARTALGAIARLITLGADRGLVAAGLSGILAQRLVRRLCEKCAVPAAPDPKIARRLKQDESFVWKTGKGCPACDETGYRGQLGVFEWLKIGESLRHRILVRGQLLPEDVPDHRTLLDDAIGKVRAGLTTPEEVLRQVPLPEED